MTFVELRLLRFRQHRDRCFSFSPGLNLVVGPNEAGKSALREALRCVLFDNPESTSQRLADTLLAWGEERLPVLELVFDYEGSRYELRKDFHQRRVILRGRDGVWERHRVVQPALHRALGFQSEKAFLATAYVRQAELHAIGERDVAEQLGRIVAGTDEDASRALQSLERALAELERGLERPATNPGRIARARQRVRDLEASVNQLRQELQSTRSAAEQLEDVRTRLEQVQKDLEDRRALLELNRRIARAREREQHLRQELKRLEARMEEAERLREEMDRLRAQLALLPQVSPQEAARVRSTLERAHSLRARAQQMLEAAEAGDPGMRLSWWPWVGAAVALAFTALPNLSWPLRVALGVLAAVMAWAGLRYREQVGRERARREERGRLARSMQEEADRLQVAAQEELRGFGASSPEQLEAWAAHRAKLEESYRTRQAELRTILGEGEGADFEEQARRLRADLRGETEFLESDEVRGKVLLPLQVQQMEREVEELEKQRKALEAERERLRAKLEAGVDEEKLLQAEEDLESARAELTRLQRRRLALRTAVEVLKEAKSAVEVPARRAVEERAGHFLAQLTGNRYDRLRVPSDAQTLRVEVWSEEASRWLPPQEPYLSRGTVDLVYLAARVALLDVLVPKARPPLLLDDPFVAFDPERRARAFEWLRTLATERQVLLFTWDEAGAPYAQAVVRLPAP